MAQRIRQTDPYMQILNIADSIRFVGRIKDRKLINFARKTDAAPLLDEELSNMVHYQASVKASWDEMFNEKLGKTNWMITSKEKVKLITLFLDDGLLILSTEPDSEHDLIISKVKQLNVKL
ncbi:conserved hypothetical protein [Nitrosotalea sinensis]|uniref:Roadblock/LAMTOR2 domain-containing protein n=1 Tax=Nitrosotalea sinensis TaxID=1499975 RepID=A0A2H1EHS9_9ARCH|nr:hypothetical protein [Candidatus Nitrosotalea sinensis]SHO45939.1 conserved hypothetical protein [Candidatus Nitrosotalea sinensis]